MATTDEINAAFNAIVDANENTVGLTYSDLLRAFAIAAIDAADRVRSEQRRKRELLDSEYGI